MEPGGAFTPTQIRGEPSLLCRAGTVHCALPLELVEEAMRPLPIEAIAFVPAFVRGLAIVRGNPIPVIDVGALLTGGLSPPTRFVTVKAGNRRAALAFSEVIGVRDLSRDSFNGMPPLLHAVNADAVSGVSALDAGLVVLLSTARLVPDDVWAALEPETPA
jgi:purine-binding chemotaxis protein CheW